MYRFGAGRSITYSRTYFNESISPLKIGQYDRVGKILGVVLYANIIDLAATVAFSATKTSKHK